MWFQSSHGTGTATRWRNHSLGEGMREGTAASIAEAMSATDTASMLREAEGLNAIEMTSGSWGRAGAMRSLV